MNEGKKKYGKWFPEKIDADDMQDFADWLNHWGDFYKHSECLTDDRHFTNFGRGYEKAISDIFTRLNLDFKLFDKRTKTGFEKK